MEYIHSWAIVFNIGIVSSSCSNYTFFFQEKGTNQFCKNRYHAYWY